MTTSPTMPTDPAVLERIRVALENEESPAPWIARAFEALGLAQAHEARTRRVIEAVETESYNGNVDESARDRIVAAASEAPGS